MFTTNATIFTRNDEKYFKDALGNTYKISVADNSILPDGLHYIEGLIRPSTYPNGAMTFVVLKFA